MADKDIAYFYELIDRLAKDHDLTDEEFKDLILTEDPEVNAYLANKADEIRQGIYGKDVYLRGLIEFTNYCKNNCRYCGIRCGNKNAERYRLSEADILSC